jgi:hypothetical protein
MTHSWFFIVSILSLNLGLEKAVQLFWPQSSGMMKSWQLECSSLGGERAPLF